MRILFLCMDLHRKFIKNNTRKQGKREAILVTWSYIIQIDQKWGKVRNEEQMEGLEKSSWENKRTEGRFWDGAFTMDPSIQTTM